jgi:serine/threonine protein kinase
MSNTDSSRTASEAKLVREKVPKQIGKYRLVRRLGAGGMGAVFLAQDEKTNRSVALKVLPREKATNETLVKRFRSEAQAAANLEHENIVRVYEADEADGYLYIALEYIDGTDVNCILRKRERMPVKRTIEVVRQVVQALQHAHEQGIVHRDIKPSNLMIRKDGVVKLTDMGLARSIDESDDTNITRAGTTVGTVDYMAPEQARNSRLADIRSDLYSLGCTWYQMLVGHPPYHEGSMTNKLQAHATARPPDPRDENPGVPESIFRSSSRPTRRESRRSGVDRHHPAAPHGEETRGPLPDTTGTSRRSGKLSFAPAGSQRSPVLGSGCGGRLAHGTWFHGKRRNSGCGRFRVWNIVDRHRRQVHAWDAQAPFE